MPLLLFRDLSSDTYSTFSIPCRSSKTLSSLT